jgi:hypothetical protein
MIRSVRCLEGEKERRWSGGKRSAARRVTSRENNISFFAPDCLQPPSLHARSSYSKASSLANDIYRCSTTGFVSVLVILRPTYSGFMRGQCAWFHS